MTNVSKGDFAKVVGDHARAGVLVAVLEAPTRAEHRDLVALDAGWGRIGVVWLCRLLQGTRGHDMRGKPAYFLPGEDAFIADCYLQRIDPETDPDAVPEAIGREVEAA